MVHHVRFAADPTQHVVQLRRLFFTAAGWPVVSPQPFAGRERRGLPPRSRVAGTWQVLRFDPDSTELVRRQPRVQCLAATVRWTVSTGRRPVPRCASLAADGRRRSRELDAVVFGSWDWSRGRPALSFSGIDAHGVAWSGTKGGIP